MLLFPKDSVGLNVVEGVFGWLGCFGGFQFLGFGLVQRPLARTPVPIVTFPQRVAFLTCCSVSPLSCSELPVRRTFHVSVVWGWDGCLAAAAGDSP